MCLAEGDDCKTRIIRLPDGQAGQVLKFEFCQEGDCDRAHREHWRTHYLVPPPGEVCRNANVTEALNWIDQNSNGWLLAGCERSDCCAAPGALAAQDSVAFKGGVRLESKSL
jgi:hypothetical protein